MGRVSDACKAYDDFKLVDEKETVPAYTVGSYLAARFSQIGLKHHFAVAGDTTSHCLISC